ncbi:MAG: hypothetical protein QM266_08120 [Bacillota bacterium]|nr:hypothetical protein [Bacillota bacterium]
MGVILGHSQDIKVELLKKRSDGDFQRILPVTNVYNVMGLLNSDSVIDTALLPLWITGGMRYGGGIAFDNDNFPSQTTFESFWSLYNFTQFASETFYQIRGNYFIAPNTMTVQMSNFQINAGGTIGPVDVDFNLTTVSADDILTSGTYTYLDLEAGDWMVISTTTFLEKTGIDNAKLTLKIDVVNNTYPFASDTNHGVVKWATEIDVNNHNAVKASTLYAQLTGLITALHHEPTGLTAGSGNYFTVNAQGHITAKEMKNASETVSGFIEIATTAEMKVDTNDALAMTPKKTKQAIDWWGGLRYYAALPASADVAEGCVIAVLKS